MQRRYTSVFAGFRISLCLMLCHTYMCHSSSEYQTEKNVTLEFGLMFLPHSNVIILYIFIFLCLTLIYKVSHKLSVSDIVCGLLQMIGHLLLYTRYVTLARHCDRLQACSEFTIGGSILYRV